MSRNRTFKSRTISVLLAVCMTLGLLPVQVFAQAGDKAVSMEWTPQTQTENGVGEVSLSAELLNTEAEDSPAAAMIEISLDADEWAALDWESPISESDLNAAQEDPAGEDPAGEDPAGETPAGEDPAGEDPAGGDPAGETPAGEDPAGEDPSKEDPAGEDPAGEEPSKEDPAGEDPAGGDPTGEDPTQGDSGKEEPAQEMAVLSLDLPLYGANSGQVVAIAKTDGGVLRILLTRENPTSTQTLTFRAPDGATIQVAEGDILVWTYGETDDIPDIMTAPLLAAGNAAADLTLPADAFVILKELPKELTLTPGTEEPVILDSDEGSKDIPYIIAFQKLANDGEESIKEFSFTILVPEGLSLPSGTASVSGSDDGSTYTITRGGTVLATLSGAPAGVEVKSTSGTTSQLTFTVAFTENAENLALTLHGETLIRTRDQIDADVVLSTVNSEEEALSAAVRVQAGEAELPGGGGYTVEAVNTSGTLPQTVAWADGNDEAGKRPGWSWESGEKILVPHLYFTINGVRTELTEETMAFVGLTKETWPKITANASGFTVSGLPTQIQEVSAYDEKPPVDVTWSLEPPDSVPDGYAFVNVTAENKDQYQSVSDLGWYYMLERQFTFTVEAKKGANSTLDKNQIYTILSNFEFLWNFGATGSGHAGIPELLSDGDATLDIEDGKVTISGLWKYNLDGSPINYRVGETVESETEPSDYKLDHSELTGAEGLLPDPEDWLQVLCDNSGVPNHSTDTDAVYDGGKLKLILSGETMFSAEKSWLDADSDSGLAGRPKVTFTLWRYQENQSYKTAAQVTGASMQLDSGDGRAPQYNEEEGYYYYPVTFTNPDGTAMTFPKYTADGYAYIYGVKEEMSSGGYEQLYEVVEDGTNTVILPDTLPDGYQGGDTRADGDKLLYQDGTLYNRLIGSVQVPVTKKWEAAAYQSEFADVAVELTLQSRPKGSTDDSAWKDVESDGKIVKHYMYRFTAERLTESYTTYKTKYDAQGRELEYRWVETAVYQNFQDPGEGETVEEKLESATLIPINDDGSFTLEQKGTKVNYYSAVEENGTIVNRIDDCIDYYVEKKWEDGRREEAVTFNLYRYTTSIDLSKVYVSFSFGESGKLTTQNAQDSRIQVTQTEDWKAVVSNLPRYDENGHPYSYLLLEETGFPEYTTTQDPDTGNYTTIVVNGIGGEAIPLLVQKVWLDDGDELHREPVTFTIYNRHTNQRIAEVTLGGDNAPGVWFQVVKVQADPDTDVNGIDDLFVAETQVGTASVKHYLEAGVNYNSLYGNGTEEYPGGEGDNDEIFDVTTANHRYQVTYRFTKPEGGASVGVQGTFTVTNRRLGNIDMTVNKTWVNGTGDGEDARQLIIDELEKLYEKEGKKLALAFQLQFADKTKEELENWEIKYSGINGEADYVLVGGDAGEEVYIRDDRGAQTSSEQVIIGVDKGGTIQTSNQAYFFGLPKYDAEGKVVEYIVDEVWLDVTESSTVPLTEEDLKQDYPTLYNLWKEYKATYEMDYYVDPEHTDNTHDIQTIDWTNTRAYTKDVVWHKEWKDDFAHNNDLRPDIYLDVYQVSHVRDGDGVVKKQIKEVMADLKWEAEDDNSWTVTLSGVQKYDALGHEITYYAVERTVAAAEDYDYQAGKYSIKAADGTVTDLGNRDEPEQSALDGGQVVDLLDETLWANGVPTDLAAEIGPFGTGSAQYALIEGGTFTNTLADTYPIEGMKYWNSLPSGWPEERLPSVTFTVYRYAEGPPPLDQDNLDGATPIAWLTVDDWTLAPMKTSLGYRYLIQYQGENTLSVGQDGQLVCSGTEASLPRYDDSGRLYHYLVVEEVNWDTDNTPDTRDQVFTTRYTDFTVTNEYTPTPGSIQIQKHLYLPLKEDGETPSAFPAVTFQLTRQVKGTDGTYGEDKTFAAKTVVLKHNEVESLYDESVTNGTWASNHYVTGTLTFENLPLYAPDGSEYHYTVTEVKDKLLGYNTWADKGVLTVNEFTGTGETGNVVVAGLTAKTGDAGEIQATFMNRQTDSKAVYTSFTATKIWDDNDNAYKFRPTDEDFKELLILKRSAPAQSVPGGGGAPAIDEELVLAVLTITPDPTDSSKWSITIDPADGSTGFEKYAPNGMAWQYTFRETTVNNRLQLDPSQPSTAPENNVYAPPAGSGGKWPNTISNSKETNPAFGELTNTTHMNYSFSKEWVDADGEKITQNYLGEDFKLTVNFQLQVSDDCRQTWQNAEAYFADKGISTDAFTVSGTGVTSGETKDTASITGTITSSAWGSKTNPGGTFSKLPTVILDEDDNYISLQYQVIETSVSYGKVTQTISDLELDDPSADGTNTTTGSYTVSNADTSLVRAAWFTRYDNDGISISTNQLSTMEVSVEKIWDDGDNQYNTRPDPDLPMTWTSWFVLQRSIDQEDWENVAVVKLYGGNGSSREGAGSSERWTYTFSGLPTADYAGSGRAYTYQVRELQPRAGGYTLADPDINSSIVAGGEDDPYNPDGSIYFTTYQSSGNHWTVTNSLDPYKIPEEPAEEITVVKDWAVPDTDGTVKPAAVTFELQYRTAGSDWQSTAAAGFPNARQSASQSNHWEVTWTGLPSTIGGEKVQYQVVEIIPSGADWVQIGLSGPVGEDGVYTYTVTNTFTRDFTVEKNWNPTTAEKHEVTVWLYRTTDQTKVGTVGGQRVPADEMDLAKGYRTAVLNDTSWTHTFTGLPQYDKEQNLYYYYALEVNSEGTPVENGGEATLAAGSSYVVSYVQGTDSEKTVITNTPAISMTGKKTWLDDSNQGNTRPADLTLILERKVAGDSGWTPVTGAVPVWDKTSVANQWSYTYSGLPQYDPNGQEYTYRVREQVPEGYQLKGELHQGEGDVNAESGQYNFTNLRTDTVMIYVNKTWVGDTPDDRPENIELKVERKLISEDDTAWQSVTVAQPNWTKTGNTWSLTYSGLPRYDGNGVRYQYRVTENGTPVGYEKKDATNIDPDSGYVLQNIRRGELMISKRVTGDLGETGKDFNFTVMLTGTSLAGTAASGITGTYQAVYTRQDGSTEATEIAFAGGISTTPISLKHKEHIVISGLPAGVSYQVEETGRDGYSTTGSGWDGTIPTGGRAEAEFVNNRSSSGGSDDTVTVSGKKTWVDSNNAEKTRPGTLELILYRSVNGGAETVVQGVSPTWVKNGNVWTYIFRDLPEFDSHGNRYTYRVVEKVPEGYVSTVDGNNFTNTLTDDERITLTGQKYWEGDTSENRPEHITVVLYDAGGQEVRRVTVTAADGWRYVFADLPRYDAQGNEIAYYVREERVPAGYEVQYSGMDIINRMEESFGGLQVSKQVTGSGAEYDRAFSFTVTLSDTSINGVYGGMTFVNGVASFTLKHGQTAAAAGLPAGISYTVTEQVPEGYTASSSNAEGVIPAGSMAAATFVNTAQQPEIPEDPDNPDNPDNPEGPTVPTGDEANLILYAVLTVLFVCGLFVTLFLGRKPAKKRGGERLKH